MFAQEWATLARDRCCLRANTRWGWHGPVAHTCANDAGVDAPATTRLDYNAWAYTKAIRMQSWLRQRMPRRAATNHAGNMNGNREADGTHGGPGGPTGAFVVAAELDKCRQPRVLAHVLVDVLSVQVWHLLNACVACLQL